METENERPWEDRRLRHHFYPVNDDFMTHSVQILCLDCHQTRWISWEVADANLYDEFYGCCNIPFWYQLRMSIAAKRIPRWDVNDQPPWVKRKTS